MKNPALLSLQFSQDFLTFIVLNIDLNLMNKWNWKKKNNQQPNLCTLQEDREK